ncbi:MAG: hypothetical protein JSU00_30965 [Acidobacteria bacterium]|nr:hypothetical protein [Acidobacteriota bacterium]
MRTALFLVACAALARADCNVRDYGATGRKDFLATKAIQAAIEACAAKGGGTVLLPAGDYTSGTIRLRSHVRLYLDPGATLYASLNDADFEKGDRTTLIYAENVENISIEGRGTIDGQASYDQRIMDFDDAFIRDNMLRWKALGKPLLRAFPARFPNALYPKLALLIRCKDVRITGVTFRRSRSWTIHPVACEHVVIDGVRIYSSLAEGVWADGIDPDGCKDVHIANSTIETGDDAIVFYSMDWFGPAQPCENITVTNCRLSSASSAIKFCDGNKKAVRRVTIANNVITDSNRGVAFMNFDGGLVSDVVITNLTVQTRRHAWFWWGDGDPLHFNIKRRSEVDGRKFPNEPPAGKIEHVILRDIIAEGQGTSMIHGHPDSWLDDVTIDNLRLRLTNDPSNPMEKATDAIQIRWARNLRLRDIKVEWGQPASSKWESGLRAEDIADAVFDGLATPPARPGLPGLKLVNGKNVVQRNVQR